jgi:hypothetical protein
MPETLAQWAWFLFFAGGAAGGWLVLAILAGQFWIGFKKGWRR